MCSNIVFILHFVKLCSWYQAQFGDLDDSDLRHQNMRNHDRILDANMKELLLIYRKNKINDNQFPNHLLSNSFILRVVVLCAETEIFFAKKIKKERNMERKEGRRGIEGGGEKKQERREGL